MLTNQRAVELLNGSKPITQEEKEWIENHYKQLKQNEKEREDFEKRYAAYKKEVEELVNKYAPKKHQKGSIFKARKFKKIEKKIDKRVERIVLKDGVEDSFDAMEKFYKLKQEILKNKYNIDWYPEDDDLPKEYFEELKQIRKKYKVTLFD